MVKAGNETVNWVRQTLGQRSKSQLSHDIVVLERLVELESSPDREVIADRLTSLERHDPSLARCVRRLGAPEALIFLLHIRTGTCDRCRKYQATIGVGGERICAVCFLANS